MKDTGLISRGHVVKLLVEKYKFTTAEATELIEEVPPADRPTGEWVDYGDCEDICSVCRYSKVHEPNYPF